MPYTRKVPTERFAKAHSSTRQAPLPHLHAGKPPAICNEYPQTPNATSVPQKMGTPPELGVPRLGGSLRDERGTAQQFRTDVGGLPHRVPCRQDSAAHAVTLSTSGRSEGGMQPASHFLLYDRLVVAGEPSMVSRGEAVPATFMRAAIVCDLVVSGALGEECAVVGASITPWRVPHPISEAWGGGLTASGNRATPRATRHPSVPSRSP